MYAASATILDHSGILKREVMMSQPSELLPSTAERRAAAAADLPAFGGFNLVAARRDLTELLSAIRSNGIFEEYTKYDIGHIDAMLSTVDWIIPDQTQEILTIADWLLIVLSAYFHDLGMIVTKQEFASRSSSAVFEDFKETILHSQDRTGQDFAARIAVLEPADLDRFLYQEYVRHNHASRIRDWIQGRGDTNMPAMSQAAVEVRRILQPLEAVFREDLGIVCESHHLDDLDDTNKYPVSRPYGTDPQENGNVQYAAVILRTIDLLHITRDRAPSIAFRIINPQDPISQREWARHAAVRQIRSKVATDNEGNLDKSLPRDTIEVHARYKNANDYFGLTSYLEYAEKQIRLSNGWIAQSNKRLDTRYFFPWRYIDPSNIEAVGFLNRPFEFRLDQRRILELLTGHTLYNDSSVVLRELVQNSVDAVRLAHGNNAPTAGRIGIEWNDCDRALTITDNGTGMSQEVIENNFLHVGASYYQEPKFKKDHPDFNPISRFGIGVLSTFMISDQVEVLTCHVDEPKARRLELRTVHGKYLISLIDKSDEKVSELVPSGTRVRLVLRPSAKIPDVLELARRWVLIPGCQVHVRVDGGTPVLVGYDSVKAALEASLQSIGVEADDVTVKVVQRSGAGVSAAYALRWSAYFKEWQFYPAPRESDSNPLPTPYLGTCVEGIRVLSGSPGFLSERASARGHTVPFALVNISGRDAPRTNVARSDFEMTAEYNQSLLHLYQLYCSHLTDEIRAIQTERGQSITYASSEAEFLAAPISTFDLASSPTALLNALSNVPLLLVEEDGLRREVSATELMERREFWTIHGAFPDHIEYLLRELPASISFTKLLQGLGAGTLDLPRGLLLCTRLTSDLVDSLVVNRWAIAQLRGNEERRRCEARWVQGGSDVKWGTLSGIQRIYQ